MSKTPLQQAEQKAFKYDNISSVAFAICIVSLLGATFVFFTSMSSAGNGSLILFFLFDVSVFVNLFVGTLFKVLAALKEIEAAVLTHN